MEKIDNDNYDNNDSNDNKQQSTSTSSEPQHQINLEAIDPIEIKDKLTTLEDSHDLNKEKLNQNIIQNLNLQDFCLCSQNRESFLDLKIIPLNKIKLSAPFPTALSSNDLLRKKRSFLENYKMKDTGIICINQDIVNSQSGIFKEIAMQLAKNLFKSGSVISLSLPIRVFEEKSMLEKYCDWWVNCWLLKKAGRTKDLVESFKYVIAFCLSSLHFSASQLKPFNPILGETFQGEINDSTDVYLEHTSHHPCVSNFYVKDKDNDYYVSGYYDMQPEGTMKMLLTNYVYLLHKGKTTVYLKESDRKIDVQVPKLHFGGIIIGERTTLWDGFMKFEDRKNNLKAIVHFNNKNTEFHSVTGEIFRWDFTKEKKKEFYETSWDKKSNPQENQVLSKISGSYLGALKFDGKEFVNIKDIEIGKVTSKSNVLPSDARYREDINWLNKAASIKDNLLMKKEFESYAQEWKLALEAQQRFDKKLRETACKKKSKWSLY